MPTNRLDIAPLTASDLEAMASLLWDERVYRFIGGLPESREEVIEGLTRALAGPPADRVGERWLNYGMRLRGSGQLIGRLEATVHDGIAEVAFLLGPDHWGSGYAAEGLEWLHAELARSCPEVQCWATALPDNTRSCRLLMACGYERVDPAKAPRLLTYDEGDEVFRSATKPLARTRPTRA